jgi:hypothetical protein
MKLFCVAAAGMLAGLLCSPASAATVTFVGDGSFKNVSGCSGGSPGCSITNNNNLLDMSGQNNSTLKAIDVSGTFQTNVDDYVIGKIEWVNNASYTTDQDFNVKYEHRLGLSGIHPQRQADD